MRPLASRAAILCAAMAGCGGEQKAPLPPVVIEVPGVPSASGAPREAAPAQESSATPTRMTLLLSGNTFLAYVSVPEGDSWRDKDDAVSAFFYKGDNGWIGVSGCERAFTCDVSGLMGSVSGRLSFKAVFLPESGSFAPAEAEHRVR